MEASDVECCLSMEECLDDVLSVLAECAQLSDHSDIHAMDKSVLSLKSVCSQLSALLNEATVTGELDQDEDVSDFKQLHLHLCLLCLEYKTKLVFLLTLNPSHCVRSLTYGRRG